MLLRNLSTTLRSARSLSHSSVRMAQDNLVANLFLKQIRDLASKQKAAGGSLVNSSPEIKKQLDEQLNRLAQKFHLESAEVVGKLNVEFEKPKLESSVAAATEGKTLDQMLSEVEASRKQYEQERQKKQQEAAKTAAALSSSA